MYRELELEQHCFWWTKTNENGKNLTNGPDTSKNESREVLTMDE